MAKILTAPDVEARDFLASAEYERLVAEFIPHKQTIEEYTRGDAPTSLTVDQMHALFERIYVAGYERCLKLVQSNG